MSVEGGVWCGVGRRSEGRGEGWRVHFKLGGDPLHTTNCHPAALRCCSNALDAVELDYLLTRCACGGGVGERGWGRG